MTTRERTIRLRRMLERHRAHLLADITGRLRTAREDITDQSSSGSSERVERFQEEDLDDALLGMRTENIRRINDALRRLDEGKYGLCAECGHEISDSRLVPLPFAIRCRECEEVAEMSARWPSRRSRPPLFEANL